jgi:1-aminocyclopropane-1-carboxylate deaminase
VLYVKLKRRLAKRMAINLSFVAYKLYLLKIIRFESKLTIKFPNSISVTIKREDLIHFVSGNKFRKLKYNLLQAKKRIRTLLTFGGLF